LKAKANKFRFRKEKNSAAIVAVIDPEKHLVTEDTAIAEELKDYDSPTIEEVAALLPAHLPRYILYSCPLNHDDGRVSYPLCFIFLSPIGSKPELHMLYAGSKLHFIGDLKIPKVYEVRDLDELTDEWLNAKLTSV